MRCSVLIFMFLQDELLAELAELEQEEHEESMKNMGRLPSVPTTKLPSTRPSRHASKNAMTPTHSVSTNALKFGKRPVSAHLYSVLQRNVCYFTLAASKKRVEDDHDMKRLAAWAS